MKNGTPYRKMLLQEKSTCLESMFAWSLRKKVGIQRNIFRRSSNIFIRINYWFIVVRRKTLIFDDLFLTVPLCVKRSMSLEPFLSYHRYYPEFHICSCTIVTLQKCSIPLDAYLYETTDEWIKTLPSLLNSFSRGSFLGHAVFSVHFV